MDATKLANMLREAIKQEIEKILKEKGLLLIYFFMISF